MPIQITSNIKMLYYDKIGLSQGIDINKTSESIVNEIMLSIEKKKQIKRIQYLSLLLFFKRKLYISTKCLQLYHDLVKLSDIAI